MSNTPVQEPPAQELSSGSGQTLPSRPFQSISDPSASKRVCFYKSGDNKFGGHRMVINARTFKTFDALLDALSKKVPLPFGVRTITTPRGTHLVRALSDLHDGGSYVCSDQKRVKPLNLEEVNRRQVPWNTTRPFTTGRRMRQGQFGQFGRRNETSRPAKVAERVAVRTPKKLLVIKNRDPTVKRTIVLQRRTAPTFDALLDYLSQILQFPVLKLFSTDGRRVDGLAALILCSGVVVAAGNEPFRLGNYSFNRTGQMAQSMYMDPVEPSMLQPRAQNNKSYSSGRGSRNFSLSSERYIVDQVNKSRNGSMNDQLHHHNQSFETEANHRHTSVDTCGTGRVGNEHLPFNVPQEDDIEKSFRVNQDGSMTVEMKVHLTIKEEEILQWTTTLSRSSLSKRTVCASIYASGNSSPDSNNAVAKGSSSISEGETKEENHSTEAEKGVSFNSEQAYESYTSPTLEKARRGFKRTPTPGPRHVSKKASVESVKMVTESGVQESTLEHYSYMERTADGETTEGYHVVRHSSSSSKPIPKPRKTASAGTSKKGSHSSIRSSGVAEVLQIQNNGMEVTETVMHIYESQGCYDNYFANEEYSVDGVSLHGSAPVPESKSSTVSVPCSSSNDCDIDFSTTDSLQRQKEEMLSLSSEPTSPTHEITNTLSSVTENEAKTATNSHVKGTVKKDKTSPSEKTKKLTNPARSQKSSTSTSSSDKKKKESIVTPTQHSKHSSTDKLSSNASVGKKSLSSSESAKNGKKSKEKPQIKKAGKDEKTPRKEQALLANAKNAEVTPPQRQNRNKAAAKENGHNVNTPTGRPQMKKNMLDILQPKRSLSPGKKTISKPKSMIENRISSPKESLELSESFSMPSLNPSPSEIHRYVESWLETVSPDPVPYTEEATTDEAEPQTKVVFQIGGDSGSDEQSESQPVDVLKKSASCLSVPHYQAGPPTALQHNEHYLRGLCVSMPSVRVDPVHHENRLRPHKSAEAIGPADEEPPSTTSGILSPKAKIRPALRQLCSSIQCIRRASDTNTTSNLEKSNSLPDFPTQVASVFGSSCKALLSFLSVMTLRDIISDDRPKSTSEAMLMMESLQKISAIEDKDEQRASLTDLQSRASSQFRERWMDFQILRQRLESEPLSPKVSETEFALDVVSEGGDVFEEQNLVIDELMEELNMPQELRAKISSTIQQATSFYPVEESTFVETEKYHSDSEEDLEKFVEECDDKTKQSTEPDTTSVADDVSQTKPGDDDNEQVETMAPSEKEPDEEPETGMNVKESEISQPERDEPLKDKDEEKEEQAEEDKDDMNDREDGDTKEKVDDEETEIGDREREDEEEERAQTEEKIDDNEHKEWEAKERTEEEEETVEKVEGGTEEEMTVNEEEEWVEEGVVEEKAEVEVTDAGSVRDEADQEPRENDSVEETDEREGDEETEEEEKGEDAVEEEAEEAGNGEEGQTEVKKEFEEEADNLIGETEEREEIDNITEEVKEEEEEEEADAFTEDIEEEVEEGIEETQENEIMEVIEENDEEEEVENINEEIGEEEEEDDEEADAGNEIDGEDKITVEEEEEEEKMEFVEERDVKEEEKNMIEDIEEEEEEDEEADAGNEIDGEDKITVEEEEEEEEETMEFVEERDVKEEEKNMIEDIEEEEEEDETNVVTEKDVEDEVTVEEEQGEIDKVTEEDEEEDAKEEKDEEDDRTKMVSEENYEEEEEREEEEEVEEVEDVEDVELKSLEERDKFEEEGEDENDVNLEEEECDEGGESRKAEDSLEEESEEKDDVEEMELEENTNAEQTLDEEEQEDDEDVESNELNEGLDKIEEEHVSDDADSIAVDAECKVPPEEALCLQQQSSCEEEANVDTKTAENDTESSTKNSSEGPCEDEKSNGTDTFNELENGEEEEHREDRNSSLPHPVEISQELLDFVNSALQSSSLIFKYDAQGNIRIEPDYARVIQATQTVIPKSKEDRLYGLKRLPSPGTSDLSDYRPETSESGGYKTQDSVDVVTESGEEASEKPFPVCRRRTDIPSGRTNVEQASSKLPGSSNLETLQNSALKSEGSFSSLRSGTKASGEDLSYFSAASSQRADVEPASMDTQCMSFASEKDLADGILIDQGRWLLKENHLIRKSPPVALGMYGNADSTSSDTGQENNNEDSLSHNKTQQNPLATISSSELEEMARPQTPKCTYFNMPHGSDSDPFLDDSSFKNGQKDAANAKGRGFRVSPTIDTSRTWASKNGSLSSFASVEFKIPDRKVHPEGESSAVTQARRTSSGGGSVLQAQDSLDTLHVRCGQYCPIL